MKLLLYLGCPTSERPDVDVLLRSAGFAVRWTDDAKQVSAVLEERIAPVVVDLRSADAIPAAAELRHRYAGALIVAAVDRSHPPATERARLVGLTQVLELPIAPDRWLRALSNGNGCHEAAESDGIVACSPAMQRVVAVLRSASCDAAGGVLLSGEPGTGRRFLARALHDMNRRPGGRLVEVDCATPAADLELTLFGTRSDGDERPGRRPADRITRASLAFQAFGGSLLLHGIVDAPARLQRRLVRLLRDGEAALSGGGVVHGPIRTMAAVEPGIESAVAEGRVRPDLLKRLAVTRIAVPPLRDRRDDIPALVDHFLTHACLLAQLRPRKLSRSALTLLASLPYRGNARELRSLIATLVEDTRSPVIHLEDVLRHLRLEVAGSRVTAYDGTLRDARERFERQYVRDVLERHHGRVGDAARSLGILRTNLYRKMRTLGVEHRPPGRRATQVR